MTGTPLATDLLKQDHEEAVRLFERYEADDATSRLATFETLAALLTVHAQVEEELFYPELGRAGAAAVPVSGPVEAAIERDHPDAGRVDPGEVRLDPDAARALDVGGGPTLAATPEVTAQDAATVRALDATPPTSEHDVQRMLDLDARHEQPPGEDASPGLARAGGADTALGAGPGAGRTADFEGDRVVEGGGALTERASGSSTDLVAEAIAEHADVKTLLREMRGLPPASAEFEARYIDLRDAVLRHATEEEAVLFPRARRALGEDGLARLGEAIAARKAKLEPAAKRMVRRRA